MAFSVALRLFPRNALTTRLASLLRQLVAPDLQPTRAAGGRSASGNGPRLVPRAHRLHGRRPGGQSGNLCLRRRSTGLPSRRIRRSVRSPCRPHRQRASGELEMLLLNLS